MKKLSIVPLVIAIVLIGCRAKPAPQVPSTPQAENVVGLLPDDDGGVGRIQFTNSGGSVELTEANSITIVTAIDVPPGPPVLIDPAEVSRRFGAALDGLPAAQAEFTLYFDLGEDRLTAQSEAVLPDLLRVVQERHSTDVSIIGHTDSTGTTQSNYELGLRRAERVAQILRSRGLDSSSISVESHGEGNLLIATPDNVEEPRNRRVEVTVR